jgi:hypothetical protein
VNSNLIKVYKQRRKKEKDNKIIEDKCIMKRIQMFYQEFKNCHKAENISVSDKELHEGKQEKM